MHLELLRSSIVTGFDDGQKDILKASLARESSLIFFL